MEIIISEADKERINQVIALSKKLDLAISKTSISHKGTKVVNGKVLYKLMKEKTESGGFEEIKDPVNWQRELSKDKPLSERDE